MAAAAITVIAAITHTPPAFADPDPHIPNGGVNWCPGGDYREHVSGGGRYCRGESFADGTFYAQSWGHSPSPFGPGRWTGGASCSQLIQGFVQVLSPDQGGCGGGPRDIFY